MSPDPTPASHDRLSHRSPGPRPVLARVLVVDDEPTARATADAMLRGSGNEVRMATTAHDGLIMAQAWRPDVVLLDVMMADTDGFELCRQLRAEPANADLRVFLLTALDDPASRLRGFDAGADEFITKPMNRAEMLARISGAARVNRYRTMRDHQLRLATLPEPATEDALIDLSTVEHDTALDRCLATMALAVQPIVELDGDDAPHVHAHEVLMRPNDPAFPNPMAVLHTAARLDRLADVGRAVRARVAALLEHGHLTGTVFVNVTSADLADDALYHDDPLAPHACRIVFEITEHESLERVPDLSRRLQALRDRGYRFAVDDLGSGYSSLNNMALIEPDYAKLDRELVADVEASPTRATIVHTIIDLCTALGIALIGEGVETAGERDTLIDLGCRVHQGYFYARPAPHPHDRRTAAA